MKTRHISTATIAALLFWGGVSCEKSDHSPSHGAGEHDDGHDHSTDATEDSEDHDHDRIEAGPNGGRLITTVEPHAEFFVTEERKVQIAFFDGEDRQLAPADQTIRVIAGERSSPTRLTFARSGDILLSDAALPEGNRFPLVLQITPGPGAQTATEKFTLDLEQCPTCENREYACTCDHEHD